MYKILDALDDAKYQELVDLQKEVTMREATSHRRRVGANGTGNLSIYSVSKFLTWKAAQRKVFKENFPAEANAKALVKWFQEFPEKTGFLDLMTYWKDEASPNYITAYCLAGNGGITFNGKDVIVPVKQGIVYSLNEIHNIKQTADGSIWACVMTRSNPWQ